jgi:hypothetical protein
MQGKSATSFAMRRKSRFGVPDGNGSRAPAYGEAGPYPEIGRLLARLKSCVRQPLTGERSAGRPTLSLFGGLYGRRDGVVVGLVSLEQVFAIGDKNPSLNTIFEQKSCCFGNTSSFVAKARKISGPHLNL